MFFRASTRETTIHGACPGRLKTVSPPSGAYIGPVRMPSALSQPDAPVARRRQSFSEKAGNPAASSTISSLPADPEALYTLAAESPKYLPGANTACRGRAKLDKLRRPSQL